MFRPVSTALPAFPPVGRGDFINSGGFADIYQDPRDPSLVLKRFKNPQSGELADMVSHLISIQRWARPSDRHIFLTRFSWPIEAFGIGQQMLGFSMPKAPDDAYFTLTAAGKTRRELLQMKFLMSATYWQGKSITSQKPDLSEQDRLEVAIDLHDAIRALHEHDLVYSDYSGNNLVVRRGEVASVFILDADSIATPDLREKHPVKSPSWEVPDDLDPTAADRSLFALWCWRFLTEEHAAFPSASGAARLRSTESHDLVDGLLETYQTGDFKSFRALSDDLRRLRNDERDARAIRRAAETGFARLVILEARESRSKEERELVELAERHIVRERQIESQTASRQQLLISRATRDSGPFILDFPPNISTTVAPTSPSEFWAMLYDARESELAAHLAEGRLQQFEDLPLMLRVARHALAEVDQCRFDSSASPGTGTIKWHWPMTSFVNHAELRITGPTGKMIVHSIKREPGSVFQERQVALATGGSVDITLTLGIATPSGSLYLSEDSAVHMLTIPAKPVAPAAAGPRRVRGPGYDENFDLVDLVELQRQHAEAVALRRKKRLVRSSAAAVIATSLGTAAWFASQRPVRESPPACSSAVVSEIDQCLQIAGRPISWADRFNFRSNVFVPYHQRGRG